MADKRAGQRAKEPVIDIYARLSYAVNGETVKVDDQVEMGEEALERRGARLGQAFRDNSLSAWNPKVVRPDWEELMRRLETGVSDGVWVYDLTRFSRKPIEGERLVKAADRGVRVWSNAGEYDLTTADGRKQFRDAMNTAAYESDKISERVKRGKLRRARKGRHHGGGRSYAMPGYPPRPDGWEPGDVRTPVSEEQVTFERAIVREGYDRMLAGEGISTIVRDLNARGVRGTTGGFFSRTSFARTLRRPAMAGLLAHNGQIIGELAGIKPVVTMEEWERLCALLDGRKIGRPNNRVHLLSGLLRCPACGQILRGYPRKHLPPYPDGEKRREYRCLRNADVHGCGRNHIDARVAEEAVKEATRVRLGDPRRAAQVASHLSQLSERRAELEAEISLLEESADRLATKTAAWGVDRVDKAMEPILGRMEILRSNLAGLASPEPALAAAADAVAAWDEAVKRNDVMEMRRMIRHAFPNLSIRPNEFFNHHTPDRLIWDHRPETP